MSENSLAIERVVARGKAERGVYAASTHKPTAPAQMTPSSARHTALRRAEARAPVAARPHQSGLAVLFALPLLALVGCSKPAAPTEAPSQPPALTAEVQQAAVQRGTAIAAETFSLLSSNLQAAIQSGGLSNALPFCSLAASPLTAGMAQKHGVTLRRITHKARNPAGKASEVELAVLQSFAVALAATTNPPPPFATNLISGQATFFAPIVLNNELCLKCHGEPGKDISTENLAVIRQHYPQDEATGFKLGDLRGAWRIDFPLTVLTPAPTPPQYP
jgi:hypothetical protein